MPNNPKPPLRKELEQFLKSQRLVKAFEQLFELIPNSINTDDVATGSAQSSALQAQGDFESIKNNVQMSAMEQYARDDLIKYADILALNQNPTQSESTGYSRYDKDLDSISMYDSYGIKNKLSVTDYTLVSNNTGSTINPLSVVYASGAVSNNFVDCDLFISDGSINSCLIVGVTSNSILDTANGKIVSSGILTGVNTSSFSIGDILYASAVTPGALTITQPSSPNIAIQIGIVIQDDAIDGRIFIDIKQVSAISYASILKNDTQSPGAANTAEAIEFTSIEKNIGVSISGTPTVDIDFSIPGLYKIDISLQLRSLSAATKNFWLWINKNTIDVSGTTKQQTLYNNDEYCIVYASYVIAISASDTINVMMASDDTDIAIQAIASSAFYPSGNSCNIIINKIGD